MYYRKNSTTYKKECDYYDIHKSVQARFQYREINFLIGKRTIFPRISYYFAVFFFYIIYNCFIEKCVIIKKQSQNY